MRSFLEQDDPVLQQLRLLLTEHGRFPTRRTGERRFEALPTRLLALLGCLGRYLVTLLQPWAAQGHAAAVDSTPLRANGGVWQKKHRLAGVVPHSSIDTEAAWSRSGYPGWWYGSQRHLAVIVGSVWMPLAAEFTIASAADKLVAPKRIEHCHWRYAICSEIRPTTLRSCARYRDQSLATGSMIYDHVSLSYDKVMRMWRKLVRDQFVTFVED